MKTFIKNLRGVSNIVGALMLVLIVVSASASLAIFVSQRQQERQKQEAKELMIELEKLAVKSINHIRYDSNNNLREIKFTVANLHTHISKINMITINDFLIREFNVTNLEQSQDNTEVWSLNTTKGYYIRNTSNDNDPHLNLNPNKRIFITIENFSNCKYGVGQIESNDPISFEVSTILTNTFEKTFYPPSSIIKILTETRFDSSINNYKRVAILDGSLSEHPTNEESYITSWKWNISLPYIFYDTNNNSIYDLGDEKIRTTPLGDAIPSDQDKGGVLGNDTNGNLFLFEDKNANGIWNKSDENISLDPDGDGINAYPEEGNFGILFGNDSKGNLFTFRDIGTIDWKYDSKDSLIDLNPDGNKTNANPKEGNYGGKIAWYTIQTGQKTIPKMDYLNMYHKIKLTVTDNQGMKGTASTTYYQ